MRELTYDRLALARLRASFEGAGYRPSEDLIMEILEAVGLPSVTEATTGPVTYFESVLLAGVGIVDRNPSLRLAISFDRLAWGNEGDEHQANLIFNHRDDQALKIGEDVRQALRICVGDTTLDGLSFDNFEANFVSAGGSLDEIQDASLARAAVAEILASNPDLAAEMANFKSSVPF